MQLLIEYRDQIEFLRQKVSPLACSWFFLLISKQVSDVLPKTQEFDEIFLLRYLLSFNQRGGLAAAEHAVRERVKFRRWDVPFSACNELTLVKKFSYIGDIDGKEPLFFFRIGHSNPKGLMNSYSHEQIFSWINLCREFAYQLCDARTRKTRKLIKLITILDFDNFSFFRSDGRFGKAVGEASKFSSLIHPQLLGRVLIMNAPRYMRFVMNALSYFMSKYHLPIPQASQEFRRARRLEASSNRAGGSGGVGGGSIDVSVEHGQGEMERATEKGNDDAKIKVNARSKEQLNFDVPCDGLRAAWEVKLPSCRVGGKRGGGRGRFSCLCNGEAEAQGRGLQQPGLLLSLACRTDTPPEPSICRSAGDSLSHSTTRTGEEFALALIVVMYQDCFNLVL
eukprot:754988-Hanusia_phi.AAC.1